MARYDRAITVFSPDGWLALGLVLQEGAISGGGGQTSRIEVLCTQPGRATRSIAQITGRLITVPLAVFAGHLFQASVSRGTAWQLVLRPQQLAL